MRAFLRSGILRSMQDFTYLENQLYVRTKQLADAEAKLNAANERIEFLERGLRDGLFHEWPSVTAGTENVVLSSTEAIFLVDGSAAPNFAPTLP